MLVLAIDTSTKVGSVALFDEKKGLLGEILINVKTNHSDTIMNAIDYLMTVSGVSVDELGRIAVTLGPGSFTGIRIGIAIAKAMVFGKKIEIVAMNTLDLLAHEISEKTFVMPLIDAKKGRAYYSFYKNEETLSKLESYKDGEIKEFLEEYKDKEIVFTGDGAHNYKELIEEIMGLNAKFIPRSRICPRAGILAEKALSLSPVNDILLEPYYHSKTQAEREKEAKLEKTTN